MPPYAHPPRLYLNHTNEEGSLPPLFATSNNHAQLPFHSVPFGSWVESWEWWTSMLPRARFYTVGLAVHKRAVGRRAKRKERWRQLRLTPD